MPKIWRNLLYKRVRARSRTKYFASHLCCCAAQYSPEMCLKLCYTIIKCSFCFASRIFINSCCFDGSCTLTYSCVSVRAKVYAYTKLSNFPRFSSNAIKTGTLSFIIYAYISLYIYSEIFVRVSIDKTFPAL